MSEPDHKRGRSHDADGAREAILNAAEAVFAEHGFDGARIDAIGAAANYNTSLIFRYFGDKLNLYAEVIRRADQQARELQIQALAELLEDKAVVDARSLEAALRKLVGAYFDYLVAHPRITRMYLWEMAEGWQTYLKIGNDRDYEDIAQFGPIFRKLQDEGLVQPGIDPLIQVAIAIFSVASYLGIIPMYQRFFPDSNITSLAGLAQGRKFIVNFVVRGLLPALVEAAPDEEADPEATS